MSYHDPETLVDPLLAKQDVVFTALRLIQQIDPTLAADAERIASAMTVVAIAAIIIVLGIVAVLIMNLFALRSLSRLMKSANAQIERLAPRTDPLIEKMTRLATDAQVVTERVRRSVSDLMGTVDDLNKSLRQASRAGERRVREFGAVLDVVKEEAEEILMDSAATARGIHTTAEALRGRRPERTRIASSDGAAREKTARDTEPEPELELEREPVPEDQEA